MNIPFLRDHIFAQPYWLLLLFIVPLMIWLRGKRGKAPTIRFSTAFILSDLGARAKSNAGDFKLGMVLLSLVAAIISMARPQKVISHDEDNTEGIAICLTVDVSL